MRGMSTLVQLRSAGQIPDAVFVYLVDKHDDQQPIMSDKGNLAIEIRNTDALVDIDFRPLVGLKVFLCDVVGDAKRYRQLGVLIAAAEPWRLVMPMQGPDGLVVHYRENGTTETF